MRETKGPLLIFSFLCCLVFLALYRWVSWKGTAIERHDLSEYAQGDASDLAYCLEAYISDGNGTEAKGWLLNKSDIHTFYNYGMDVNMTGLHNNFKLCLSRDGSVYELPTKIYARPDVELEGLDDIRHERCGFVALLPEEVSLENAELMVLCKSIDGDERLYDLGLAWGETGDTL